MKKEKRTAIKKVNKLIKKHHRYIYWVYHWFGKIRGSRPFQPPQIAVDLKSYLQKY